MIDQMTIFEELYPTYKIDKPIRLIELFAGIGSQAKALKNLGADFEHWKVIEWDKYPMASYNAIHGTNFETSDITKIHASDLEIIDRDKYCYIMTYSFPCQDLSLAGKLGGMTKGTGTRSGLLWEVERILDECNGNLPDVLLMENVPQVIGKNNIKDFQLWRKKLEELGYSNYVELLNAKDFGIPQNRNRCFMVSILGEWNYTFPKKKKLKIRLKDLLEKDVDEKYYLSDQMVDFFRYNSKKQEELGNGFRFETVNDKEVAKAITTRNGSRMDDNFIETMVVREGGLFDSENGTHQAGSVYNENGLSPSLDTMQGGYRQPMIEEKKSNLRIRKLTPCECYKLMGFSEEDYKKASQVNSDSQLYKQAGNSIVVNVLMAIFGEMLDTLEK